MRMYNKCVCLHLYHPYINFIVGVLIACFGLLLLITVLDKHNLIGFKAAIVSFRKISWCSMIAIVISNQYSNLGDGNYITTTACGI
jgi:hypothetical protein